MLDALAIPLFFVLVGGVWVFVKITTPQQRDDMLWWFLTAIFCFGGAGLLYTLLSGRSIAASFTS